MAKTRGFKNVAREIAAKQNIALEQANAILAKSTRGASASARKKNPRLNRVT